MSAAAWLNLLLPQEPEVSVPFYESGEELQQPPVFLIQTQAREYRISSDTNWQSNLTSTEPLHGRRTQEMALRDTGSEPLQV